MITYSNSWEKILMVFNFFFKMYFFENSCEILDMALIKNHRLVFFLP